MCGRYHIDRDMVMEIEDLAKSMDIPFKMNRQDFAYGDLCPNDMAPVLFFNGKSICCRCQHFGFPGKDGQLIFNARSESAAEKVTFRESILHRRVVIPTVWFYEWNKSREKNIFLPKCEKVMYLAGCFNRYQGQERFVILTTAANESMKPVHDRMPLILERDEVEDWLRDEKRAMEILLKEPARLNRKTEYEQLSLF